MRALVLSLAMLLLVPWVPVVSAEHECPQVHPWSRLCEGDVLGFVGEYVSINACIGALQVCIDPIVCSSVRECIDPGYACPGGPPCPRDPDV